LAAGVYRLPFRVGGQDVIVLVDANGDRLAECLVPPSVDVVEAFDSMRELRRVLAPEVRSLRLVRAVDGPVAAAGGRVAE
jgi:predicted transcriptional regulator